MTIVIYQRGLEHYKKTWRDMQDFTQSRSDTTPDELWMVEHPPVYTFGLSGKSEHLLHKTDIPVINTDRGGQITYHGPGQLVLYFMINLQRANIGVRTLISAMENSMIAALSQYGITASAKPEAPGVYVNNKKIGSVGLRIKRGASYHGLSINNCMELQPFEHINTCGFHGLEVTQLADYNVHIANQELAVPIIQHFCDHLSFKPVSVTESHEN